MLCVINFSCFTRHLVVTLANKYLKDVACGKYRDMVIGTDSNDGRHDYRRFAVPVHESPSRPQTPDDSQTVATQSARAGQQPGAQGMALADPDFF